VSQVAVDAYTPALPQMVDDLHSPNQFMRTPWPPSCSAWLSPCFGGVDRRPAWTNP